MIKAIRAERDLDWMVNFTKNFIGEGLIIRLKDERCIKDRNRYIDTHSLHTYLHTSIRSQVAKMSNSIIDKICDCSSPTGLHLISNDHPVQFLNFTGYTAIFGYSHIYPAHNDQKALKEMATVTIICILRDILMQETWQSYRREQISRKWATKSPIDKEIVLC